MGDDIALDKTEDSIVSDRYLSVSDSTRSQEKID